MWFSFYFIRISPNGLFVIFFVNTYVLVVIFYEKISVLLIVISKIKNVKSCYLNVRVWGLIHQINEEK